MCFGCLMSGDVSVREPTSSASDQRFGFERVTEVGGAWTMLRRTE